MPAFFRSRRAKLLEYADTFSTKAAPLSHFLVRHLQTPCVRDVSLDIGSGECVSISGPSGSGKTLLLRCLADLDPVEGQMELDGKSYLDFSGPRWRRQVALLTAESFWWCRTFAEHFEQAPAAAILARLNLPTDILDKEVERGSTGERQRLALLRLLQHRPAVLLLDEPTANLDDNNRRAVEDLIADYLRQRQACALWTSHDRIQIERVATRHFLIHNGQLESAA